MRIIISVSGGIVQSVRTDSDEIIDVEIFDWDDKEDEANEAAIAAEFATICAVTREVY